MGTHISRSAAETESLGETWGVIATPGWVLGISGDLGTGKTHLIKGLARGLGIVERILSPTFALVHQYHSGRLPLYHLDFYRLASAQEIVGAGLEEYLTQTRGVTAIEWIERWKELPELRNGPGLGINFRRVHIEQVSEDDRRIDYEDIGP